ncbi:unnamed protein product [Ilex paraguariensis]|uniref:DUF7792 domain-containing protein n=1 Tax=Ilex paraguariensis TaxID=185542 RepID=A0ABC8RIZ8_9AQUA
MAAIQEKRIDQLLSFQILLSEQIKQAADVASSFKFECCEVGKQADRLCAMLRSAVGFSRSSCSVYERPVHRIVTEVSKNLNRAQTLVLKCKRRSILRRVFTIVSVADFRKVISLLESSIGDMKWLLSVFDSDSYNGGINLALPPIASNDPILSWVWSFIASVHLGQLNVKIDSADELASLAQDNDRNKKIIVEEGGIPPLLKLLKENSSPEAQIAATTALFHLANHQERVRSIIIERGVPIIVTVLGDSPMRVQVCVANLVARMAEHDSLAQEDFSRENVIRPLVTLLSLDIFVDHYLKLQHRTGKQSIHSIVEINKEMEKNSLMSFKSRLGLSSSSSSSPSSSSLSMHNYSEGSSRGGNYRRERENEKPEMKLQLKISCAEALWRLSKSSVSNSRKITETKGLLCLAKLVEKEQGELQINCLMTVMEITAAAESNSDLRRAAFKTNSPAAKAVVEQLLRVVKESDNPSFQIPAIRSIGSLARTFPARETRLIGPLVEKLGHRNQDVAAEAAISLGKLACPENFLCVEHSKTIIEFYCVPPLMRLLRSTERTKIQALILLCYLALHAGNSEDLEQARVLTVLEGAERTVSAHHPELRELLTKAMYSLNVYHSGVLLPQRQYYA